MPSHKREARPMGAGRAAALCSQVLHRVQLEPCVSVCAFLQSHVSPKDLGEITFEEY